MSLYTKELYFADSVRQVFMDWNRDDYPIEVYEYILETELELSEIEDKPRCLDVVSWCCDLDYTTLADYEELNGVKIQGGLDELSEILSKYTTVIYADHEAGKIYYLAY